MRTKPSVVRIQDVARVAGVSVTTASRVLNNKDDVAPETYEKVRRVMTEMNYTASLAAKSMRSRTTNVIGLVLPDVTDAFNLEIIRGVGTIIRDSSYDLLIYTSGNPGLKQSASWEQEHVALLSRGLTDGCIVVTPVAPTFHNNARCVGESWCHRRDHNAAISQPTAEQRNMFLFPRCRLFQPWVAASVNQEIVARIANDC